MQIKGKLIAIVLCLGLVVGCDAQDSAKKADEAAKQVVAASVKAEPVLNALEDAAGPVLTETQKSKAERVVKVVHDVSRIGGPVAGGFPGGQGIAAVLGVLTTISAGVLAFLERRKTKKERQNKKAVARAAVKAADSLPGGGKAISDAALRGGVGNEIRAALGAVRAE